MTAPRLALLVGLALVAPALAGCAGDSPSAKQEPLNPGSTTGTGGDGASASTTVPPAPKPKTTSERWHFHDYWKGSPTITLMEGNFSVLPTQGPDGLPALSVVFGLPNGVIVPPETGSLAVNVTWNSTAPGLPGGLVNVTYRPADSNDFAPGGDATFGAPLVIATTESMCDVPHRQESGWLFNLTLKPDGTPPVLPGRDLHVAIQATIGRPLFIDPPHLNWWLAGDVIPLITDGKGELATAVSPVTNLTLPGQPSASPPPPSTLTATQRISVSEGRIVPEGAKSVVLMLNWTSELPNAKLAVTYRESNLPSDGAMQVAVDGAGQRVFVVPVIPPQTDTTYSNRTTWEFHVTPEGGPAAAFRGSYTVAAWVTKLTPEAAVAAISGGEPSG